MGITMLIGCPPNLPWWRLQYMTDAEIAAYNRSFMKEVKMNTATDKAYYKPDVIKAAIQTAVTYHEKKAWNAAIEAAAKHCCTICKASENIRKLKK